MIVHYPMLPLLLFHFFLVVNSLLPFYSLQFPESHFQYLFQVYLKCMLVKRLLWGKLMTTEDSVVFSTSELQANR